MDITTIIKMLLAYRNTNAANLAAKLGIERQSLSRKMKNETFSYKDLEQISEALNLEMCINFIDPETGKKVLPE